VDGQMDKAAESEKYTTLGQVSTQKKQMGSGVSSYWQQSLQS
jgi:hypothetical protein